MKAKCYELRKNSTGFSNNDIRLKGSVVRIWRVTSARVQMGGYTYTSGDFNNIFF